MKLSAASCWVSKRNCAEAQPAFALTSYGAVHLALHPCSKLQGIRAKANKKSLIKTSLKADLEGLRGCPARFAPTYHIKFQLYLIFINHTVGILISSKIVLEDLWRSDG
jgi:hypothetical protein